MITANAVWYIYEHLIFPPKELKYPPVRKTKHSPAFIIAGESRNALQTLEEIFKNHNLPSGEQLELILKAMEIYACHRTHQNNTP